MGCDLKLMMMVLIQLCNSLNNFVTYMPSPEAQISILGIIDSKSKTALSLNLTSLDEYKPGIDYTITTKIQRSGEGLLGVTIIHLQAFPKSQNPQIPTKWLVTNMDSGPLVFQINMKQSENSSIRLSKLLQVPNFLKVLNQGYQTFYLAILSRVLVQSNSYILPFNLQSQRRLKASVQVKGLRKINLYNLDQQPFLNNYWNSFSSQATAIPWLPFLSACQLFDKRILIHDLLLNQDEQNLSVIQEKGFLNRKVNYLNEIRISCYFGENDIQSTQNPWWRKSSQTLYYLYPEPIAVDKYEEFQNNTVAVLLQNPNRNLVPVAYTTQGNTFFPPADLTLTIEYWQEKSQRIIKSAALHGVFQDTNHKSKMTNVMIKVVPLNIFNNFLGFHMPIMLYVIMSLFVVCLGCYILGKIFFNRESLIFFIDKCIKCFIMPALKGYALMLSTCGLFLGFFVIINKTASFQAIPNNFDSNSIEDKIEKAAIDNGRQGLPLFLCGVGLFLSILDRSSKTPTPAQARILLEGQKKDQKQIQNIEQRVQFFLMILNARKYYLLAGPLFVSALFVFLFNQLLNLQVYESISIAILLLPLLIEIPIMYLASCLDDIIFFGVFNIIGDIFLSICLLRIPNAFLTMLLRSIATLYWLGFRLGYDILKRKVFIWLEKNYPDSWIYNKLQASIKLVTQMKSQEMSMKAAFDVSTSICSVILRPLGLGIVYLLSNQAQLTTNAFKCMNAVDANFAYMIIQTPLELLFIGLVLVFMDKHMRLRVMELVEYSQYLFKSRISRWLCDTFGYKENILPIFRPLEKLCFSSQFYFIFFGITINIFCMILGVFIMMKNSYVFCKDPAFLMLVSCTFIARKIGQLIVSFIGVKSKLYYQKQYKELGKLQSISKFTKKQSDQEYLELEAVKHHFITSRSEWIVSNLHKILTRRNFHQDNKRILSKYILQLNTQKRKRLQNRRKQIQQEMLQKQVSAQGNGQKVLTMSLKLMQGTIQPIVTHWLALAKQYVFLKRFITAVKQQKRNCQFCKIDMELQVLEKYPFYDIVNRYRVQNVGKPFAAHQFTEFYRRNQQLITICFECKLKKEHIHRNERIEMIKSKNNQCARLMVKKWVMCARGRILHKQ